MKTGDRGIELIKKFEGCSLSAYKCPAGYLTIGYGSRFIDGRPVKAADRLASEHEADRLLRGTLSEYEDCVSKFYTGGEQNKFDALVCLVYNVGVSFFSNTRCARRIAEKNYSAAADEWREINKITVNGVKKLSNGLVRRRDAEISLFLGV